MSGYFPRYLFLCLLIVILVIGSAIVVMIKILRRCAYPNAPDNNGDTLDIEAQTTINTVNISNPHHSMGTQLISNPLDTQILPTDLPPSYSECALPSYTFC